MINKTTGSKTDKNIPSLLHAALVKLTAASDALK